MCATLTNDWAEPIERVWRPAVAAAAVGRRRDKSLPADSITLVYSSQSVETS